MRFFKQIWGKTAIFPEIFACAARHNLASGSGTPPAAPPAQRLRRSPPAHACGALAAILQLCQVGTARSAMCCTVLNAGGSSRVARPSTLVLSKIISTRRHQRLSLAMAAPSPPWLSPSGDDGDAAHAMGRRTRPAHPVDAARHGEKVSRFRRSVR